MAIGGVKEVREKMRIEHASDKVKASEGDLSVIASNISGNDYPYVTLFFQHLALCNTVMCDFEATNRRGGGEIIYKAASPDELALV
jgi:magnesium-transporting ATPase (P-type)